MKKKYLYLFILAMTVALSAAVTQIDLGTQAKGVLALIHGGTGVTAAQGNGSKVQLSTGSTTTSDCVQFDANGNTADASVPCAPYDVANGVDVPPASAGTLDDEFNVANGTAVNTSTRWTWQNQDTATAVQNNGMLIVKPSVSSSTDMAFLYQTAPATPWTVTARVKMTTRWLNFQACNLATGDGTKIEGWGPWINGSLVLSHFTGTNPTSCCGFTFNETAQSYDWYLRLQDDGTNQIFSASRDGQSFKEWTRSARTSHLASVSRVGVVILNQNATDSVQCAWDWFRRTQ